MGLIRPYATKERAYGACRLDLSEASLASDLGALVSPPYAEEFAHKLKDCRLVKLGDGIHFLLEDRPETKGDRSQPSSPRRWLSRRISTTWRRR